jgi:hypothetical protein
MNPPDTITIDGRTYSWRWLCEIRRRLLDAWKAARRSSLPCSILRTTAARLGTLRRAELAGLASGLRFLFWFHPATPLGKRNGPLPRSRSAPFLPFKGNGRAPSTTSRRLRWSKMLACIKRT